MSDAPRVAPGYLSPSGAAAYLDLSRAKLEAMRRAGEGPKFHKLNDRVIRYKVADLDAWMDDHSVAATTDNDGPTSGEAA